MSITSCEVIVLANNPKGAIQPDTFRVEVQALPALQDGEVLIKVIALGNLPAIRTWIDDDIEAHRFSIAPVLKGEVVRCPGIGLVVESRCDQYKVGDRVSTFTDWREYKVVKPEEILSKAADIEGKSEYLSLTLLGLNGLTAWAGVFKEMKLTPDSTLLVSGAAGSVGTCGVQLAKNVVGCKRVVGIAGGKEKSDWVKSLGADECVDYKSESFAKDLKAALPDEADFFFDNAGGQVLNTALTLVKRYGHVAVCGAMDGYNGKPLELTNWREVIYNRINLKAEFGTILQELWQWVVEGKLNVDRETVVETKFEDIPKTFGMLFTGEIQGTLVTKLV